MRFYFVIAMIAFSAYTVVDDIIEWSPDRKLKVTDYTLVEYPLNDGVSATTCTGIEMRWDSSIKKYRAVAVFSRQKSKWNPFLIRRKDWILNHEQLHFDITQFITCQLNKRFMNDSLSVLYMIREYDKHLVMLDSFQVMYDNQTDHGRDSAYQILWNKIVDNLPK